METNAAHVPTILIVGDSLSKGVSLDENAKRYFFLKESYANSLKQATGVDVINLSKFGSTIDFGRRKLSEKLETCKPDIVLIEFGGNDCDFAWDEIANNPFTEHYPKTPLNEYEAHLTEMVNMARQAGALPVVMSLPPLNAVSYFNWFTQGDKEKGDNILKWLGDVSKIYWWHERYSMANRSVADVCGVPLADARQYFLKTPDYRAYICSDGIHPNENGHRLMTSSILDCFNKNAVLFKRIGA